jgi:hypothetical protein
MAGKGFNIRAWLGLDTKDYEKGISKAKRQVQQLGKGMSDSIKSAAGNIGGFLDRITGGAFSAFNGMYSGAVKATKGMKGLKAAIASTGIGVLVIALGSLVTYFSKSEEGQKKMTVAMEAAKGVIGVFSGYLEKLGAWLVKIWKDPKTALNGFVDAIKNNLLNILEAAGEYIGGLADIVTNSFKVAGNKIKAMFSKGDAKAEAEAAAEAAMEGVRAGIAKSKENSLQMITGLNKGKQAVVEGFRKIGQDVAKGFNDGVKQGIAINALGDAERAARVSIQRLQTEVSELRLKSRMRDKYAEEERLAMLAEALKKVEQIGQRELDLIDKRIKIKAQEIAMGPTSIADLEEMATLEAERVQIMERQNMRMMELTEQAQTLKEKIEGVNEAATDMLPAGSIAEAKAKLRELQEAYEMATTAVAREEFAAAIEAQKNEIDKLTGAFDNLGGAATGAGKTIEMSLSDASRSISDIGSSLENMGTTGASAIADVITKFLSLVEVIQMVSAAQEAAAAAAIASNAAEAASSSTKAAADSSAAVAGATKSGAGMPFPFNLLAIAAGVAAVVAALANMQKFATGGIVGGTSFFGDQTLARVNSGEMILNRAQQANLFKMVNQGGGSGAVTFRIKGKDLVGVQDNFNRTTKSYR